MCSSFATSFLTLRFSLFEYAIYGTIIIKTNTKSLYKTIPTLAKTVEAINSSSCAFLTYIRIAAKYARTVNMFSALARTQFLMKLRLKFFLTLTDLPVSMVRVPPYIRITTSIISIGTNTAMHIVTKFPIVPLRLVYISSLRIAATLVPYSQNTRVRSTPPTIRIMLSTISVINRIPSYPQALMYPLRTE